jgi:hypothetical protein
LDTGFEVVDASAAPVVLAGSTQTTAGAEEPPTEKTCPFEADNAPKSRSPGLNRIDPDRLTDGPDVACEERIAPPLEDAPCAASCP